ncbi:MAG: CsgG/HfaB family protein [bacterium]
MRKIFLIITVLFFCLICLAQDKEKKQEDSKEEKKDSKPGIAVTALQNLGVKKGLEISVTDILATELVNTQKFNVVERMQVAKVLDEQGFQQAGVTDASKATEVGKLLNSENVLIGTLNKMGKKFIINVKIVDVKKGTISYAQNAEAHSEDYLIAASRKIVRKILHTITGSYEGKPQEKEMKQEPEKKKKKSDIHKMPEKKGKSKDPVKNKAGSFFDELD